MNSGYVVIKEPLSGKVDEIVPVNISIEYFEQLLHLGKPLRITLNTNFEGLFVVSGDCILTKNKYIIGNRESIIFGGIILIDDGPYSVSLGVFDDAVGVQIATVTLGR